MKIAVSGINGSGKTTLAKALAEELKLNYFNFSLSNAPFYKGLNGGPLFKMHIDDIKFIQREYCEYFIEEFNKLPADFITDTCPADVAAWLTYWTMTPLPSKDLQQDFYLRTRVIWLLKSCDLVIKLPCFQFPNCKTGYIGCAELIDAMIAKILGNIHDNCGVNIYTIPDRLFALKSRVEKCKPIIAHRSSICPSQESTLPPPSSPSSASKQLEIWKQS